MELRKLDARIRRLTRRSVKDEDKGYIDPGGRVLVKGRNCQSSNGMLPQLSASKPHRKEDCEQGRVLPTETPAWIRRQGLRSSSKRSQHCFHVNTEGSESKEDVDDGSTLDLDDLSSIDSDDLELLSEDSGRSIPTGTIVVTNYRTDQGATEGSKTPGDDVEKGEGEIADGNIAQTRPSFLSVVLREEVPSGTDVLVIKDSPQCVQLDRGKGASEQKDCITVFSKSPEYKHCESPNAKVLEVTEEDWSQESVDPSTFLSDHISKPLSASHAEKIPSLATQQRSTSIEPTTALTRRISEELEPGNSGKFLASLDGGNCQDRNPTSACGMSPGNNGLQQWSKTKPTIFEEQYLKYQRLGHRNWVETPIWPRCEVLALRSKAPLYVTHPHASQFQFQFQRIARSSPHSQAMPPIRSSFCSQFGDRQSLASEQVTRA
ncbi:hypothetical protein MMC16_003247 [Acarospora aff. strigata]|nr:hypothetical protein [Acarospora aff. strigata]